MRKSNLTNPKRLKRPCDRCGNYFIPNGKRCKICELCKNPKGYRKERSFFSFKCKQCGKSIFSFYESQFKYMVSQHVLKHTRNNQLKREVKK
jgi:methionyl-tRNA synthetase